MGKCYTKKERIRFYLDVLIPPKKKKIIEEIHEGIRGTHANGHIMAGQVMRTSYYWLTLENDCIKHVRKCHKCQIYADKIHMPMTELHVMAHSRHFSIWGMDVIGPIPRRLLTGIDSFLWSLITSQNG